MLAVIGVGVLGTLMAGWASANKYALLGGLRAAAQLLSYELPIVLAAASVAIAAGTLSLTGDRRGLAAVVAALAAARRRRASSSPAWPSCSGRRSTCRSPTPRSSSAPYTEYTGLRFAFFLLAEYAGIVVMSLLFAVLFLGGWQGPFADQLGWLWTLLKAGRRGRRRHLAAGGVAAAARGPAAAARLARASSRWPWPSWPSPESWVVFTA